MLERLRRHHFEIPPALRPPRLVEAVRSVLPEFAASTIVGAGLRSVAEYGLVIGGVSGLPLTIAAGAATGAIISAGRESWHQYRDYGSINDPKRVFTQSLRGATVGAIGAFVGWTVADLLMDGVLDGHAGADISQSPGGEGGGGGGGDGGGGHDPALGNSSEFPAAPAENPDLQPGDSSGSELPGSTNPILPDIVALPDGSSVWEQSEIFLEQALGRTPTNEEILLLAQQVSKDSGISVPEWNIEGSSLATELSPGHELVFSNSKETITGFTNK